MEVIIWLLIIVTAIALYKIYKAQIKNNTQEITKTPQKYEFNKKPIDLQHQQKTEQLTKDRSKHQHQDIKLKGLETEGNYQVKQPKLVDQQKQIELKRKVAVDEENYKKRCETNTDYSFQLENIYKKYKRNFSFTNIRSACLNQSEEVQKQLNQGVTIITTPEQLCQYIFSYGKMHRAKLWQAFKTLTEGNYLPTAIDQTFEIIDYGAGQGLGTVCFIDFLKSLNLDSFKIGKVKLIEPSSLALERGALHVRYSLKSADQVSNVYAMQKRLDDLTEYDIITDNNSIKIHIFSNILDVPNINLEALSRVIAKSQNGLNFFICVSPNINDTRNKYIDDFQMFFETNKDFKEISFRTSELPNDWANGNPWKRYERVFKVNFENNNSKFEYAPNSQPVKVYEYDLDEDDLPF